MSDDTIYTIKRRTRHNNHKEIQYTINETSCWICISHSTKNGYPLMGKNPTMGIHRYMYRRFKGPLSKYYVCHSCDDTRCINPEHLWLGTNTDNLQDASRKGKMIGARGEKSGTCKLTKDQVFTIRRLAKKGISQREIASQFGIDQSQVSAIHRRASWGWL